MMSTKEDSGILRDRAMLLRRQMQGRCIFLSIFVILMVQIWASRDQWFFGDEFSIFADRRQSMAPIDLLFTPHNEHWSTLPIIKDLILYKIFGFSTYLPYLIAALIVHAAISFFIYIIGRQHNVSEKVLVPLVTLFSIAYFGSENVLWGFQFGFISPLAMFLASGILIFKDFKYSREISSLLMIFSVASSGTSIAFLIAMFLFLAINRKFKDAVIVTLPAALLFLVWRSYFSVSPNFPSKDSLYESVLTYWNYLVAGGTSSLESFVKIPGSGATLFFSVSILLVVAGNWKGKYSFPTFVALAGYISFLIFAYSRAGLGIEQAKASRYSYLFVLCVAPIVIIWIDKLMKRLKTDYFVYAVSIVTLSVVGMSQFLYNESSEAKRENQLRGTLMVSAQIALGSEEFLPGSLPDPIYAPEFTIENTIEMLRDGAFDSTIPGEKSELAARTNTQVAIIENDAFIDNDSEFTCIFQENAKSDDLQGIFRILSPNPVELVFRLTGNTNNTLSRQLDSSSNGYTVELMSQELVAQATGLNVTICR
jgi:hypothetical protein